jgi:TolB-like protein/Flp pilus assembly protein TadD
MVEKLGEGGMGAVWRAVDTKLDRDVALKILPGELASDPERLARFEDEAKAVAALNHPNIVTIHSVEECDGTHFLTMELVRGKTLGEAIPKGGLKIERLLEYTIPIADAVAAAHERGLSHRDLKPANIMIADGDRVKILDFGLAQFREQDEGAIDPSETPTLTLTQRTEVRGTLPYMSPEQVQAKPLDHRTDIFSLGAVFYEMACGERPFAGETAADLVAAILRDNPRPVTELNHSLPRQLQRIIAHSMQKDRERRLQTVADLRNQLEALKEELDTGPVPAGASAAAPKKRRPERKSLAVLPLENHSGDPEQEFFADGMTEALITDLAKIGALKVISRTSVMQYKGVKKPLREIAAELGVGAILEGSVLRAGNRVRIVAQLIDAATDEHLWAERYDREMKDVLALQSEVAQSIAEQIQVQLTPQDQERLSGARTVDPEAHEACLKGRHFWSQRTPESVKKALASFEHAVALDPSYAPGYTGIADSYLVDGGGYLGVAPKEAYNRSREAARRALELDDGLAEAHNSLAAVLTDFEWDWDGAEREYRRAIELNPNYVTAHNWYADHLARVGRFTEAIAEARLAREVDPLSSNSNFMLAWVLYFARRYDESIEQARHTLELDAAYVPAQRILGWALEELGKYEKAISAHMRAAALSEDHPGFRGQLGRAYALAGRAEEARSELRSLIELSYKQPVSSLDIAVVHIALDEPDEAFNRLVQACDEHAEHVPYFNVNPRLDPLRDDPRFRQLLRRLGFED